MLSDVNVEEEVTINIIKSALKRQITKWKDVKNGSAINMRAANVVLVKLNNNLRFPQCMRATLTIFKDNASQRRAKIAIQKPGMHVLDVHSSQFLLLSLSLL